jgi:putative transposase
VVGEKMARKPRIHYEEAIYHVIARGNNRTRILETEEEKAKYLEIVADYTERYDFRVYGYVIMDNHVHLIIQVRQILLSKIMQGIQQRYTQYYNKHNEHSGHVFEQRYKAFLCDQESYLMTLLCYIHQNPVRAKIAEGINYRWSSHQAYASGMNSLVNAEFILKILSEDRNKAISQYSKLIGEEVTRLDYTSKNQEEKNIPKVPPNEKVEKQPKLAWEQLVNKIAVEEAVNQEQLLGKCRVRQVVAARKRLIYEAVKLNLMTRTQLAKTLQLDPANITRIWQELIT